MSPVLVGSVPEPAARDAPAVKGTADADDVGAVTVEAAMGICSVVAVFALTLAGVGILIGQLRCTDAAIEAARLVTRGEQYRAADAVARIAPGGAKLGITVHGDQVTTEVSSAPLGGLLPGGWLTSRAFAILEPTSLAPAGS